MLVAKRDCCRCNDIVVWPIERDSDFSCVSDYCITGVIVPNDVRGDRSDPGGSGGERLPQSVSATVAESVFVMMTSEYLVELGILGSVHNLAPAVTMCHSCGCE